MNILIVHNKYNSKGGEDITVEKEIKLLEKNGHKVNFFTRSNSQIKSIFSKIKTAINSSFSYETYNYFNNTSFLQKYDIIHVHNFFPLITPSIFYAAKKNNIPIVMTLHNYRLICPSGLLMHKNKIYEKSIKYSPYSTVIDRVYKNSFIGTFFLAKMINNHKKRGTWNNKVSRLIALTNFGRKKFIDSGINKSQIVVKPTWCTDFHNKNCTKENYALFVGRISEEKGISSLIEAWSQIDYKLVIAGDGPLTNKLLNTKNKNIHYIGRKNQHEIFKLMEKASFLVIPSTWYEGLPAVIIEAFCAGLPVIGSKIGAIEEIIDNNVTGIHFEPNNPEDLREKVNKIINDKKLLTTLSENARKEFLNKYTPEKNYSQLIEIYNNVITSKY